MQLQDKPQPRGHRTVKNHLRTPSQNVNNKTLQLTTHYKKTPISINHSLEQPPQKDTIHKSS